LTVCKTSSFSTGSVQISFPSFSSTTLQNSPDISDLIFEVSKFQHHTKLCSKCSISPVSSFKLNLLVKRVFFLLNAAFAMKILNLISRVHLVSFVIMLHKQWTVTCQNYQGAENRMLGTIVSCA
jgi:hypothetical protein